MKTVSVNKEQKLFVIPCGNGYTCLGFQVCFNRLNSLANELDYKVKSKRIGSLKMYNEYSKLIKMAAKKHKQTGWKSKSELIPEFIGNEGRRVEVVTSYNEVERYYIGKSTGFIPCHIQVLKSNSSGGCPVTGYPFKRITFLT